MPVALMGGHRDTGGGSLPPCFGKDLVRLTLERLEDRLLRDIRGLELVEHQCGIDPGLDDVHGVHGGMHDAGDVKSLCECTVADLRSVDRHEYQSEHTSL